MYATKSDSPGGRAVVGGQGPTIPLFIMGMHRGVTRAALCHDLGGRVPAVFSCLWRKLTPLLLYVITHVCGQFAYNYRIGASTGGNIQETTAGG